MSAYLVSPSRYILIGINCFPIFDFPITQTVVIRRGRGAGSDSHAGILERACFRAHVGYDHLQDPFVYPLGSNLIPLAMTAMSDHVQRLTSVVRGDDIIREQIESPCDNTFNIERPSDAMNNAFKRIRLSLMHFIRASRRSPFIFISVVPYSIKIVFLPLVS